MKTFLLFVVALISHFAFSQNRVVKDNLACLYGIKNANGDWVVKPKYILLTGYSNGYFMTQEGPNYGLLAPNGTELLSCEHTRIKPLNFSWNPHGVGQPVTETPTGSVPILFEIEKNNMRSLIDGSGKTIVPFETQFFRTDGQQHVIVTTYRNPHNFTSYIDLNGNYLFRDLPGAIEPFGSDPIALIGLRTPGSNGTVEGNVGVINKKGEFIVQRQFNRALICGQSHIVFEDTLGHIGTMDMNGRIIIQPKYALVYKSYSNQVILPCLSMAQHTFMIKDDSGKFGLMDGRGKIKCTPIYDELEEFRGQWGKSDHTWRVRKNAKMGMLRENGTISIPCDFDTIIPLKMTAGSNAKLNGFVVSDSDRYGLIGPLGDTIIPLEHPFFQYSYQSRSLLFGNPKQLSEITLIGDSLHSTQVEKLAQLTDFSIFKGQNDAYFVLKKSENGVLEVAQSKRYMNVLSFQATRNKVTLIDLEGKRLDDGDVHSINQNYRFIEAQTMAGMRYLIDVKAAKRITEPSLITQFQLSYSNMEEVWTKGIFEPKDSWVLMDTIGQRSGIDHFDQPFNLTSDQVALRDGGYWGIYAVNEKKWLISPKYTCIDILSDNIFRAQLQNGKWELITRAAKTSFGQFESLSVLFNSHTQDRNGSRQIDDIFFLAEQNGASFLINSAGEKISNPAEIKRIQVALAYGVYTHNAKYVFSRGMKIVQNEPNFTVSPLYQQLYELIQNDFPKPITNPPLTIVNERNCACPNEHQPQLQHELNYAKPNAASVIVSRYWKGNNPWDVGSYEIERYINVILVNGEMKPVELLAIFGNNDQLLYDEFQRAISLQETLDLECSTVSNMLEIIGNNYMFSEEGLVLVVKQNSRRIAQVTIPWKRLVELPVTSSFAKILIG